MPADERPSFEYRHVVTFEDTSVAGNVYYVNHLRWQGRCRELFLREHAPEVFARIGRDLLLVTTRCDCEYLAELNVTDEVVIRMRLRELTQNRVTMDFEYWRVRDGGEDLVARGGQQVAMMRREGPNIVATPLPETLRDAFAPYLRPEPGHLGSR